MKKVMLPLLIIVALLCTSCSAIPNSQISNVSVEERLAQIDAYKETVPTPAKTGTSVSLSSALSFRGIPFGSTMSEVETAESLEVTESYSDALDFEPVTVYSYSMVPSCWFNEAGLFYSGSYSMTQSEYAPAVQNLQSSLTAEFGKPTESGYYDYSHVPVTFESDDEAVTAIRSGDAYYFVSYTGSNGLSVELYAESDDSGGFGLYIFYSDPVFGY